MRMGARAASFFAVLLVLALACASQTVDRDVGIVARQACALPGQSLASPLDTAVWCAEQFIARNGYTDLAPVADTTLIAFESLEWASGIEEMLRHRHNTLQRNALGVCKEPPGIRPTTGFVVVFRYRDTTLGARGVTMSKRFQELRVEHQNFNDDAVDSARFGCRRVV